MNINTKKYIEEFLKIKNKKSEIISFKLNYPQQKLYDIIKQERRLHKPVRIIILKARQMGFSTLTEAILFKETATKFNVSTGIITHQEDATTNLFNMSKLFYTELPAEIRPQLLNSNAKELIFNNREGTGLNSKIRCMTAGSKGVGRSATYNKLHISELAFWQGDKKEILTGLLQTVPYTEESMVIIESTANGFDYYKTMWDEAVRGDNDYIPVFIGWNDLPEYQLPYNGFTLTQEEKELKIKYGLSNEQLTWRRWCIRNNCQNDIDKFKQEYPICPEEAFINSGKCYFNVQNIVKRIQECPNPIKRGFFKYTYANEKIVDYKWIDDERGAIELYELPKNRQPYVLGGDTSGDGSDFFTAHVVDNITSKQVAKLRQEYDEVEYTRQIYCLGKYYNEALVGLEANFSSYPIKELYRLGYRKQFVREIEDDYRNKHEKRLGVRTDLKTRPVMLANLQEIVLEHISNIVDKDTLREMLVFVKNENGRPEAQEGEHDDLVMGLAIAYYIREQQSFKLLPAQERPLAPNVDPWGMKPRYKGDYGSEIQVI